MKLLYLTFQEDAPLYSGVTRKIAWQAEAFERLGFEVTYSLWSGAEYRFRTGNRTETVSVPEGSGRMHRFAQAAGEYLKQHPCDVLYFRLDRMSFDAAALCRAAKAGGAKKVILEIPNYPYLTDYIRNVRGVRPMTRQAVTLAKILGTAAEDRLSGLSLRGAADAAVLIGDRAERFFGIPAVNISNGVAVSEFDEIRHPQNEGEIVLIGVAGTLWWQAYDRVLAGMAAYRKRHPEGPRLRFLLVGGDAKEMPEFHRQVSQFGLEDSVECPGFRTGKALAEYYERADLGVSSLGCYRRGLTRCSSLKAREYCAAGIPFLYAYEDDDLDANAPFAIKLPNDSSPVDMERVVEFAGRCRSDTSVSEAEREFARAHYDWVSILKKVLNFTGVKLPESGID